MKIMKTAMETTQPKFRPRIVGLSHAGLKVADMNPAIRFYSDFLGLEEQYQLVDEQGELIMKFLKLNDRQCIELFPEGSPEQDRLFQVAFIVEDAEAMREYLQGKGIPVPGSAKKGRIGNIGFSIPDPDGHIIEFVQYLADGWTSRDMGKHLGKDRVSIRLKHIGFTVRSLHRSLEFYQDILGCMETWRGSDNGETLSWVNMKLPDSDEYLELMLHDGNLTNERIGILNHICLEVDSVPLSIDWLQGKAVDGLYQRPLSHKIGRNRRRLANLFDPDSTRVELMEALTVDGLTPPPSTALPPD